ncbi:hypothetical protein AMTRI_Chr10g140 [Amborella trichopoda]
MGSRGTPRRDKQPITSKIIQYEGEQPPLAIRSPSRSPVHQITYPEATASKPTYSPAQSKSATPSNIPSSVYHERAYLMDITIDEKYINTEPIKLAPLYLLNHLNPSNGVKTREYFEAILMETGSISVVHYFQQNTWTIAYSKVQIKNILSYEEWGCNPAHGKKLQNPDFSYKYFKYAEYIEAWHKFFYYQNPNYTHSWYIQFRLHILELQDKFQAYNQTDNTIDNHLYFMALYQIPWIMKWEYTISPDTTSDYTYIPRLGKTISVKWWDIFNMAPSSLTPKRIPPKPLDKTQSQNTANTSFDFPTYLRNMLQVNPNASKETLENQMKEIFAEVGRKPVSSDETVQSSPLHINQYLNLPIEDPEETDPDEDENVPDEFSQRP